MNLTEFLQDRHESQDDFFKRSVWLSNGYMDSKIFVYNDSEHKPEDLEIWDLDKARRYVEQLRSEPKPKHNRTIKGIEPIKDELIKVEFENLNEKPYKTLWISSQDSRVVHEFGRR